MTRATRRLVPLGLAALLCAAVLSAAVQVPAEAPAQELAARGVAEVRFVDAAPPGRSVAERLAEIRRRIQAALVYPRLARQQQLEGEALVRFDIDPDGTPREVELFRSSGMPSLDRAARSAVEHAAPLPWVYGRLEVPVRFELDRRR
jgi:protein TonB